MDNEDTAYGSLSKGNGNEPSILMPAGFRPPRITTPSHEGPASAGPGAEDIISATGEKVQAAAGPDFDPFEPTYDAEKIGIIKSAPRVPANWEEIILTDYPQIAAKVRANRGKVRGFEISAGAKIVTKPGSNNMTIQKDEFAYKKADDNGRSLMLARLQRFLDKLAGNQVYAKNGAKITIAVRDLERGRTDN